HEGGLEDALDQGRQRADAGAQDDEAERLPEVAPGGVAGGLEEEEAEDAAADEAADHTAEGAVTRLAERPGGDPFADADGEPEERPPQAAGENGAGLAQPLARPLAGGADPADEVVIDQLADHHAQRPAEGAEEDAVTGQPAEARQGAVADRLDADDEVADEAADDRPAEEPLAEVVAGGLVAEDAEQHPAEQAAQGPEDRVEVDADQKCHGRGISGADAAATRRMFFVIGTAGDCNRQAGPPR